MTGQDDDQRRHRFDGVLCPDALATARLTGVRLAYDPIQIGWVPLGARDEADTAPALSWHVGQPAPFKQVPGTGVYPVTRRFGFRLWTEADLPRYREILSDPALWRFMPEEPPAALTQEDLRALIALSSEGAHHHVRAIIHQGRPIGQIRLEFLAPGTVAEISYWLAAETRGRGLGPQAVAAFLAQSLSRMGGPSTLVARVHPGNAASARLLLSCGFQPSDRAATGLGPRGRDGGDWPVYLRPAT